MEMGMHEKIFYYTLRDSGLLYTNSCDPKKYKSPKPRRNSPCPCGSGKKYKKCCISKGWQ